MISGDRIRQAREIREITQAELASAVGVDQSHVSFIEQGAREPSDKVLKAIALHTAFPVSFFRRESGPDFPLGSLLYRRRSTLRSHHRDRLRQLARLSFELTEILSNSIPIPELRLPTSAAEPKLAAQLVRASLGLSPDTPIKNLINLLERAGVLVLAVPARIVECDAFSAFIGSPQRRAVVVVAAGNPGDRLRFSVAHELGHLVMHQRTNSDIQQIERAANVFAAEFLLPEVAMRQEFTSPLTLTALAALKSRWGVSIQALTMRARDLRVITEAQTQYIFKRLSVRGWRSSEPVEIPVERPRMMRKMAEMTNGSPINYARLASLVGISVVLAKDIMELYASSSDVKRDDGPTENRDGRPGRIDAILTFASKTRTEDPRQRR